MSAKKRDRERVVFEAYLREHGLRPSAQRDIVVDAFFDHPGHVTCEELYAFARARDARVGLTTVYRAMRLLVEAGVAVERRFGERAPRVFELADAFGKHHDHLVCVACDTIVEFDEPRIEALQDAVAARHGFELRTHKHELYGVCATCRAARR